MPAAPSAFQSATRVAVEEIVRQHAAESKYGLFLSDEALKGVVADMVRLLENSRSLKSAGDRLLKQGPQPRGDMRREV